MHPSNPSCERLVEMTSKEQQEPEVWLCMLGDIFLEQLKNDATLTKNLSVVLKAPDQLTARLTKLSRKVEIFQTIWPPEVAMITPPLLDKPAAETLSYLEDLVGRLNFLLSEKEIQGESEARDILALQVLSEIHVQYLSLKQRLLREFASKDQISIDLEGM